jgi:hypothetical protein
MTTGFSADETKYVQRVDKGRAIAGRRLRPLGDI